jgi:RNA polymerase sigma factor (TIGR02999 family)
LFIYEFTNCLFVWYDAVQDRTAIMPAPQEARDDLFSLVYEELRRLASLVRRNEGSTTLNSTALVHEAWMKLKDSAGLAATSPAHFKAIATKAMRQVLVDQARRRNSLKRGGGGEVIFVEIEGEIGDSVQSIATCDEELLALDTALEELALLNPRQARMVESRFFGGLSVAETAVLLDVSESSIERDWRASKAWLASRIRPGGE